MENATAYTIILTDRHFQYLVTSIIPMFLLYNLILIIAAPEIKKFIKEKMHKKKEFRGLEQWNTKK